jgi:hypothetical protein
MGRVRLPPLGQHLRLNIPRDPIMLIHTITKTSVGADVSVFFYIQMSKFALKKSP